MRRLGLPVPAFDRLSTFTTFICTAACRARIPLLDFWIPLSAFQASVFLAFFQYVHSGCHIVLQGDEKSCEEEGAYSMHTTERGAHIDLMYSTPLQLTLCDNAEVDD